MQAIDGEEVIFGCYIELVEKGSTMNGSKSCVLLRGNLERVPARSAVDSDVVIRQ